MMRITFGLLLIFIIGFTSCEGRKTQRQALAEDIEEFKKTVSVEVDVYQPETYIEREVDTLLQHGFRVKIKTYTDMDSSVLFTRIKDTINYQTHYRNYKFDIWVEKDGKTIYNESFNKQKANETFGFKNNLKESDLYNFDKLAILKSIQLNDDPSHTNLVAIDIMYAIPETDNASYHSIMINEKGNANFIKISKN